jgi:arylsulfatase
MKFLFFDQPDGWIGGKITRDMPTIYNIRQDPFERYPMGSGQTIVPPMQDPASFNLDAVKKQIDAVMRQQSGK